MQADLHSLQPARDVGRSRAQVVIHLNEIGRRCVVAAIGVTLARVGADLGRGDQDQPADF